MADSSTPEPDRRRVHDAGRITAAIETMTVSGPPQITSQVVPAIRCARCGESGIPMQAGSCPNCGASNGWAQIHPVIHIVDNGHHDLSAAVRRQVALRGLTRGA